MFEICNEGIGGLQYNVGMCVREVLDFYMKTEPNRATPEGMAVLLDELARIARAGDQQLKAAVAVRINPTRQEQQLLDAYLAWWGRYEVYADAVQAAPAGDRAAIRDNVTIPLLYGTEETPGGILRGADIRTPFTLANGVGVSVGFRKENFERFIKDLKEGAERAGKGLGWLIAAVAGLYLLLLLKD